MTKFLSICLLLLLCSCDREPPRPAATSTHTQEIRGRATTLPIYQVSVSDQWLRRDPLPGDSLADTTKSLCDFLIRDEEQHIRITIHNFPSEHIEERVPPAAQVARWEQQFESVVPQLTTTIPQAFSGYSGLLLTSVGQLKGDTTETMMLGWGLQIAPEHYRALSRSSSPQEIATNKERRADVTIKAVGPRELMEKHQKAIIAFAHSFELIEEIPSYP